LSGSNTAISDGFQKSEGVRVTELKKTRAGKDDDGVDGVDDDDD